MDSHHYYTIISLNIHLYMKILSFLFINSLAVLLACYLVPGASVDSIWVALAVAVILGLINTFVKPILVILTLPITIITLGLFYLILNTLLILFIDWIVPGFHTDSFWSAFIFSLIVSFVFWVVNKTSK